MSALWEVGAVVKYDSRDGAAVLLVVAHESYDNVTNVTRAMVLWGNGEFAQDIGGAFAWDLSLGVTRRVL